MKWSLEQEYFEELWWLLWKMSIEHHHSLIFLEGTYSWQFLDSGLGNAQRRVSRVIFRWSRYRGDWIPHLAIRNSLPRNIWRSNDRPSDDRGKIGLMRVISPSVSKALASMAETFREVALMAPRISWQLIPYRSSRIGSTTIIARDQEEAETQIMSWKYAMKEQRSAQ
jgi:hypothetical protein